MGWAIALYILYMIWVFAGDEWHQRGRPKPQIDSLESFKALLSRIASRGTLAEPAAAGGAARRSSAGGGGRVVGGGGAAVSRDELEESLLPWVVAEDEEVTAPDTRYNAVVASAPNRRSTGGGGPAAEFEGQLPPFAASPVGWTHHGAPGAGGLGLRSTSSSSQTPHQQQQQHSTELAAPQEGFRSPSGFNQQQQEQQPSSNGAAQRRVSAPTSGDDLWASTPDGTQRHASLPQQRTHHFGAGHLHVVSLGRQGYIDPKTYKQLVWADLADDEEEEARLERQIARQLLRGSRGTPSTSSAAEGGCTGNAGGKEL